MSDEQDILRALDLPQEAIPRFLAHAAQFCIDHGGQRHYGELLALLARYQAAATEER
ncbi:hypothetical protein PO883_23870 [Massilia sp. DJPM01]|uniref:hypothetical protein n=1 Tax=Massilia sp. DJPM01 TaxID=3024404 RepID=UPI00259E9647|nr:hypothetical protein [Massilia sp. DJPM01]MDM5180225.1 hypothetical protein [Massilia sp. DJPM01]